MISFIILNYKSTVDTINCINSIKKLNHDCDIKIIVVDNASLNSKEIKQIKPMIDDLILLDKNLGFAKGNNEGCKLAINKYNPDFLCVVNSDIIINQKNFIKNIYKIYDKYEFDVLGPKILPLESDSKNPFNAYENIEQVENKIKYIKKLITIYKNPLLRFLLKIYINFKAIFKAKNIKENYNEDVIGKPLHGCALIFSKKYYKKYNDVFYNETFLFHEEEFLYFRCKHDNLTFVYSPDIELIHKEGQSLNKEFKDKYKKLIFRNEEILKSLLLLEKVMKEGRKI